MKKNNTHRYNLNGEIFQVSIQISKYVKTNQPAIILTVEPTKEPFMTASVALVDEKLAPNEVAIKTWGGQEDVLAFLTDNHIVSAPKRYVSVGYVMAPICDLLA